MNVDVMILDIESQRDFFAPGGSCYTPAAGRAAKQLAKLFVWARKTKVPVLSTVLRVRAHEHGPMAEADHCIEGSDGEKKLPQTLLASRVNLGLRNTTDLPPDLFGEYQQVIVEKRYTDIFVHARIERLLTTLRDGTFILCGAGVAHGIAQAAIGLRTRGFGVVLAEDAVTDLGDELASMAMRRMEAKGVIMAPTSEITTPTQRPHAAEFRLRETARK